VVQRFSEEIVYRNGGAWERGHEREEDFTTEDTKNTEERRKRPTQRGRVCKGRERRRLYHRGNRGAAERTEIERNFFTTEDTENTEERKKEREKERRKRLTQKAQR